MIKKEELKLVTEWDKTFPKSDKVDHSKWDNTCGRSVCTQR